MRAKLGRVQNSRAPPLLPTGILYSPIARIERPIWRPVDWHLRSHGKIGDCEQSTLRYTSYLNCFPAVHYTWKCNKLLLFLKWLAVLYDSLDWLVTQSFLTSLVVTSDCVTSHCYLTNKALANSGHKKYSSSVKVFVFQFVTVQYVHYFTNWHCFDNPVGLATKVKKKSTSAEFLDYCYSIKNWTR